MHHTTTGAGNIMCRMVRAGTTASACVDKGRMWTDFQITSHFIFVLAILVCLCSQFCELAYMTSIVLFLSVWYHKNREHKGLVAALDSICAKSYFIYAVVQMSHSPSAAVFCVNATFALTTSACFVATHLNTDPSLYECIHPLGLHICPGLWALFVSCTHEPILLDGHRSSFSLEHCLLCVTPSPSIFPIGL